MFQRTNSMAQVSTRLIETLDLIENRVELLRQQASAVETEKECLISLIQTVTTHKDLKFVSEGEKEEIQIVADRLMGRCLTVEVQVSTPRNASQQEALSLVDQYIEEELLNRVKADLSGSKAVCEAFINACVSEPKGPIDLRFQSKIIECAAEDQKKIRKRLESLFRTIEHTQKNVSE